MPRKVKSHYEVLGILETATTEQIKQARKRKARKVHPDKAGGNHDEMAEVNRAFDVLSDPQRRLLYDSTGQDQRKPIEDGAKSVLFEAFSDALSKDAQDCLKHAKRYITKRRCEAQTNKALGLDAEKKLNKRRDKIFTKSSENIFHLLIDQQLHGIAQAVGRIDHAIAVFDLAMKILEGYGSTEEITETITITMDLSSILFSSNDAGW